MANSGRPLLTAGLLAVQTTVGQLLVASERLWLASAMNLGWGASYIFFTFMLVHHGAMGMATARLLAYLAHACWTLAFAIYIIKDSSSSRPIE
jgi:hypothetical protein